MSGRPPISTLCASQAKKLSSSFTLNCDESVVLQKLSLNVHTLGLKKNSLLFLLSITAPLHNYSGIVFPDLSTIVGGKLHVYIVYFVTLFQFKFGLIKSDLINHTTCTAQLLISLSKSTNLDT